MRRTNKPTVPVTYRIWPEQNEQLRKLAFTSGRNKSQLIREAIDLLMKTPKEDK
tara:strand:- start:52 stop:213 length:162 start_codon:yes stop_codon:yes gene_type:complete